MLFIYFYLLSSLSCLFSSPLSIPIEWERRNSLRKREPIEKELLEDIQPMGEGAIGRGHSHPMKHKHNCWHHPPQICIHNRSLISWITLLETWKEVGGRGERRWGVGTVEGGRKVVCDASVAVVFAPIPWIGHVWRQCRMGYLSYGKIRKWW